MNDPKILFEDKHILIVQKPVGMLSQPSADTDAPALSALLLEREKENGAAEPYIGIVHRLDCGVGGAMVYAKKPYAAGVLSAAIAGKDAFTKEYLCIVSGVPDEKAGTLTDLLWKDARQNKVYVVDRQRNGVREATLSYTVLDTKETADGAFSLLRVRLGTGRSHQIRAQLSHRGYPILGDGKYGGRHGKAEGIALWSYHLAFEHPANAERRKGGRTPNPKAPAFVNPDIYCLPDYEAEPFCLFAETAASLKADT